MNSYFNLRIIMKNFVFVLLFSPVLLWADSFVEGKDYQVLHHIHPHSHHSTVEITEFFSFGCPWCYRIELGLHQWLEKKSNIHLNKVPVIFNKNWRYYAKAYYTANALGLNHKLDPLLFKAIQVDKRKLTSNDAMIDFFVRQGVDKETAKSAFTNSTTIDMKITAGSSLMSQYQITAVPALVVDGRYKTDLQMAQTETRLLQILDYLVAKARASVIPKPIR